MLAAMKPSITGEVQGKVVPPSPVNRMMALSVAVRRSAPVWSIACRRRVERDGSTAAIIAIARIPVGRLM